MQAKIENNEYVTMRPGERAAAHSLTNSIYKLDKTANYLRKKREAAPITPKHRSFFESKGENQNAVLGPKDKLAQAGKQVVGVAKKRIQNYVPVLGKKRISHLDRRKATRSNDDAMSLLNQPTSSMVSTNASWSDATKAKGDSSARKNPLGYFQGEHQFVFFLNTYKDQLKDIKRRKWVTHPLQGHKIAENMRARMMDWMVEVMRTFDCSNETYFLSVSIFDRFLDAYRQNEKVLQDHDVHLLGVCSMFLANKFQEPRPLGLQTIYSKIGHKTFTRDEILKVEEEILASLEFDMNYASPYDVLKLYFGGLAHAAETLGFKDNMHRQLLGRIVKFASNLLQYAMYNVKNLPLSPFILAYISMTSAIRYCKHKPGIPEQKLKHCKKELTTFLKRMYKEAAGVCLLPLSKHIDKSEQEIYEELIKLCSSRGKTSFMKQEMHRLARSTL